MPAASAIPPTKYDLGIFEYAIVKGDVVFPMNLSM
jgi:hypothetical protein